MKKNVTKGKKGENRQGKMPTYQNAFKFKHNPNSKKTKKILSLPNEGLCKKCHDIIEWKKQYRKYKPLSVPGRCTNCQEKKITRAYHLLCDDCASNLGVCAKCKQKEEIITVYNAKRLEEQEMDLIQKNLDENFRLREKRTILRRIDKGELTPQDVLTMEPQNPKDGGDLDFGDDDFDDDDDFGEGDDAGEGDEDDDDNDEK